MKLRYTLLTFTAVSLLFNSCSSDSDRMSLEPDKNPMLSQTVNYPEEDSSILLSGTTGSMVRRILQNAPNNDFARNLSMISITEEQYNEIAAFTTELVKECKDNKEKYNAAFNWITSNIEYQHTYVDNTPYAVFTTKKAICQGYADLLTVMMHTQNIPCFTISGDLYQPGYDNWYIGGHAWNYVYTGSSWYVSDPTNSGSFIISSMSSYSHLRPSATTIPVYEDENYEYNFYESQMNICTIKSGKEQVVIPYSVNNIRVTSLNPSKEVPSNIKEIYIGKNITSLGVNIVGLSYLAPSVELYNVDPENNVLESFSNVIYKKNGSNYEMYLVAESAKEIELKPIENFDKESKLKDLKNLEVVIFAPGTKTIGAWTVEKCPKLHTAYIPEDTKVDDGAFSGVASDFKIVRGNYTNIPQIKY